MSLGDLEVGVASVAGGPGGGCGQCLWGIWRWVWPVSLGDLEVGVANAFWDLEVDVASAFWDLEVGVASAGTWRWCLWGDLSVGVASEGWSS